MLQRVVFAAAGFALAAGLFAGPPGESGPPPVYTMLLHHEFHGANPEAYFLTNGASQGSWCEGAVNGECLGYAQISVPDGALLEGLDIWSYDVSAESDLHYGLIVTCDGPSGQTEDIVDSGDLANSAGESHYSHALPGITVNNADCGYTLRFKFTDPGDPPRGNQIRLRKARLTWHRQVSPAPLTAAFADVPTDHPFFQFVEALSRSGITAGCNSAPPLYCPDAPLTRGQMAVFLAKALGLQWPVPLSE